MPVRLLAALLLCAALLPAIAASRPSPKSHKARVGDYELLPYDPVADPRTVVVEGNARFTVITSRLVRMEWSDSGVFLDQATLAFVNRNAEPRPQMSVTRSDGVLSIATNQVVLHYTMGAPFNSSTLKIEAAEKSSVEPFTSWVPGQSAAGNLLGTIRSLDDKGVVDLNCTLNADIRVHQESLHCAWGIVSRDGWSVVDDSSNYALDDNGWWAGQNTDTIDWYMFAYGWAYKDALADFVQVAGRIPLTPRYASGIWWSIWMNYNMGDVQNIVLDYENRDIPLDVYILDMDWHSKEGWGGYSFDKRLFPFPNDALGWLHHKGLAVGANLHDDDGVRSTENMYRQLADVMGYAQNSTATIPFSAVNDTYVYGLEDQVLKPLEDIGMSLWWIDWQQGGKEGGCAGLAQNPTIWLNKIRCTDSIRRRQNERQFVLARWGGLGNHRYQVGFSGDVLGLTWKNMAYQPYFSLTAANVGYGFWSHDIVGPPADHELHVRWVQFAAYSGIFRTHDRGMSTGICADTEPATCAIVKIWELPNKYFEPARAALQARSMLVPYIYTAVREAYDNGLSLIRPMYYDFPQHASAYLADPEGDFAQYFFGPDMFVSPVVRSSDRSDELAEITTWVPPGCWYEELTGVVYEGTNANFNLTKLYALTEIPVFVRCGAVIPRTPLAHAVQTGSAQRQYTALDFSIYPGVTQGTGSVYEDDGRSLNYVSDPEGSHAFTKLTYTRTSSFTIDVNLETLGTFDELPAERTYIVRFVSAAPIQSAKANGKTLPYSRFGGGGKSAWHYDAPEATAVVVVHGVSSALTLQVVFESIDEAAFNGVKGMVAHATLGKRALDDAEATVGSSSTAGGYLSVLSSSGDTLSYLAGTNLQAFENLVRGMPSLLAQAQNELLAQEGFIPGVLLQLWDESRQDSVLCGSSTCASTNAYYTEVRIEGYQPLSSDPNAVPLNDFWDSDVNDNYATTSSSAPAGYSPANFANGYVLGSQQPGTLPLALYYSSARHDHVTVASKAGHFFAKQWGYDLVNATLGYVLSSPPSGAADAAYLFSGGDRVAYAQGLLDNVFV
eukprot:TRINITY_DN9908_c0_g1_i1.p1 TRINITY_DN9908_c0_g1~~TRINITY_DN9908_c0_g1_i1.p1  ORF type:complete len:1085 (-),score=270.03 TRINITY_DN9908_c0_g1_i1:780-3968(-)